MQLWYYTVIELWTPDLHKDGVSLMCNWVEIEKAMGYIRHVSLERWSNKIVHHVHDNVLVIYEKLRMEEDKGYEKKEEAIGKRKGERQEKR